MKQVSTIAVVGACAPERREYAKQMAAVTDRMLLPASRLEYTREPAREAAELAPWTDRPAGVVIEFPGTASVADLIATLGSPVSATDLAGVICVVDSLHLIRDLSAEDYVATRVDRVGRVLDCSSRALLTVSQIEHASTILLVNWEPVATPELSVLMALVSHLSPHARLRLQRDDIAQDLTADGYDLRLIRAGWARILHGDADPHMTDPRVDAFRYEQLRPLHPDRLRALLDDRIESGGFGTIVRSAGYCRFASRPQAVLQWDHVGQTIAFRGSGTGRAVRSAEALMSTGQELAFIGLDLDHAALCRAFDEAALTDQELAAGAEEWERYENPFPTWRPAQRLPK